MKTRNDRQGAVAFLTDKVNKVKNNHKTEKTRIFLLLAAIVIYMLASCQINARYNPGNDIEKWQQGNTNGNIQNIGYVVKTDDYLFYSGGGRVYRVSLESSERTQILRNLCENINIVGNWIYYTQGSPGRV